LHNKRGSIIPQQTAIEGQKATGDSESILDEVSSRIMSVSDEYLEFVLDQLEGLGTVFSRRMFGGVGLYCDDLFFGLIDDDLLYFKVDEITRERYESAGSTPFRPFGEDSYSMSYYRVPAELLEDRDELARWAREAVAVAVRKLAAKRRKGPGPKGGKSHPNW